MKKYVAFLIVCFFVTNVAFAQEVPEIQRPLISKIAATWCPPCGGWAWDMFEDLIVENEEKATLLVAHHSGDLVNSVSEDFSANFNSPYQPYFYYNIEDQDVTATNVDAKLVEIKDKIETASVESPIANAGILLNFQDDVLTVSTKTRFFQEATGEYYLGVYFVESNIANYQAGQGNDAIHEKVMRGAISSGSFGELLDNGTISSGSEFTHTFEASLANLDKEHLEVITIIWKKEDDTYFVVNTNVSDEFLETVSIGEFDLQVASLEVLPSVVSSSAKIILTIEEPLSKARLFVIDIDGNVIQSIYEGGITNKETSFEFEKPSSVAAGLYYIVMANDHEVLSKAVIFE